jgi:8-oxo-dGTP diphosphatase
MGRRRNAHGEGTFGWPGGGLAFGETLQNAVKREAMEEAGLVVRAARLLCVSNVFEYNRHYLDLEFEVTAFEGLLARSCGFDRRGGLTGEVAVSLPV